MGGSSCTSQSTASGLPNGDCDVIRWSSLVAAMNIEMNNWMCPTGKHTNKVSMEAFVNQLCRQLQAESCCVCKIAL